MLIVTGKNRLLAVMAELQKDALSRVEGELRGIKTVADLSDRVKQLRAEVSTLGADKAKREEEMARKERETEHKIGLERKRQAFELESGKKEATLKVREENLTADRARFDEQMKFHEQRFTAEVGYLKDMLSEIVKRLPSAEFTADLTATTKRGR